LDELREKNPMILILITMMKILLSSFVDIRNDFFITMYLKRKKKNTASTTATLTPIVT